MYPYHHFIVAFHVYLYTGGELAPTSAFFPSLPEVHELLSRLGVEKPKEVSCCHKRAILKGYIVLLPPEDDPCQRAQLGQGVADQLVL